MLEIKDLHVSYGGIQALRGVSLNVPDGKIVTLIGANGAGKSTLMRTISGLVKAQSGSILWNGQELLGKPIDQIVASGIAMSPEGRRVFADLTVLENLKIGAYLRKDKAETEKDLEWVYSLFPPPEGAQLAERRHPFRRRAADAGRGPRPDEQAEAAHAGRAEPRPCTHRGAGDF